MTDRQRFETTMHYQARDRSPIVDFNFWDETLPAWHEQGLPRHIEKGDVLNVYKLTGFRKDGQAMAIQGGGSHRAAPPFFTPSAEGDGNR